MTEQEKLIGDKWDNNHMWRKQLERRLSQIGSEMKGTREFMSDRILDLVEQIDELRAALKEVRDKQERMAAYLKQQIKEKVNGD